MTGSKHSNIPIFDQLKHLTPNSATFQIAIWAYAYVGDWKRALSILRFAEEGMTEWKDSRKANQQMTELYCACITAYEKAGDCESGLELFESMKAKRIRPDVRTFCAAISVCEKRAEWERALQLIEKAQLAGFTHQDITLHRLQGKVGNTQVHHFTKK